MSILKGKKIAVLAGGTSCEREISLISGKAVFEALRGEGLDVILLDPAEGFIDILKNKNIDLVFLALHGSFGEDGTVQELLDRHQIAYTGSGAAASRRAFDKSVAQLIFQENGIRVPQFQDYQRNSKMTKPIGWKVPYVIKPATCGSSVGITIVREENQFEKAMTEAFRYSDTVLMEEFIRGRELTVGILGEEALPIVEVVASRTFYDYEAKYKDGGTRYEVPAVLTAEQREEMSDMALKAFQLLGCQVLSRADILLGEDGRAYILELNTIPGLTNKSLLPKAAQAKGLSFAGLCVKILELSLLKRTVSV